MELNFDTLREILNKETNELLDEFIEYIDCSCDSFSLIDIINEIDSYDTSEWIRLIEALSKDLKDYDVSMDDEDDLTDEGYDFLILFVQREILEEHKREYIESVF